MEYRRSLSRDQGFGVVTGTSTVLVRPNPKRVAIMISAPATGRLTVAFGRPAVLDQGINVPANTSVLYLKDDDIGQAVCEEITAVASGTPVTIGWLEVFV